MRVRFFVISNDRRLIEFNVQPNPNFSSMSNISNAAKQANIEAYEQQQAVRQSLRQANCEVHDVVQITDTSHHWFPALIVVTELKSWGIQGYSVMPTGNREPMSTGQAFIRLNYEQIERVGKSIIIPKPHDEEASDED